MNIPKVSVILTVYNTSEYLRKCLDTLINQTLRQIEIICVNDGSVDESGAILEEYAEIDDRIQIVNTENCGAGAARNVGLSMSSGHCLSILDSDDFFSLDMLEKSYNMLIYYNLDFVVFSSRYYNDKTNISGSLSTIKRTTDKNVFSSKDIEKDVFGIFVGWAWDKLYKREFITSNNLTFQEIKSSNDLLFVYKALLLAERISIINDELVYHRIENGNSVSNSRGTSWKCFYHALEGLSDFLHTSGLYSKYENDFVNYSLHFSLWNLKSVDSMRKETYNLIKNTVFREFCILDIKGRSLYNNVDRFDRFIIRYSNYIMFNFVTKIKAIVRKFKRIIKSD